MSACPKNSELLAWADDAEQHGNHMVPIHRDTLRAMAARVAAADQAAKRAREAAAAYLRGCADRLEKGGAT